MADSGFNKTQLTQLENLFDKNNKQTAEYMAHIVDSLSETIENTKSELLKRLETVEANLDSKIYAVKTELKDEIQNLSLTMSSKYEVESLNRRVTALEHPQLT